MIHVGILEWHNGLCAHVTNEHAFEIYIIHGRTFKRFKYPTGADPNFIIRTKLVEIKIEDELNL